MLFLLYLSFSFFFVNIWGVYSPMHLTGPPFLGDSAGNPAKSMPLSHHLQDPSRDILQPQFGPQQQGPWSPRLTSETFPCVRAGSVDPPRHPLSCSGRSMVPAAPPAAPQHSDPPVQGLGLESLLVEVLSSPPNETGSSPRVRFLVCRFH